MMQTVTVQLPKPTYDLLEQVAKTQARSIPDTVLSLTNRQNVLPILPHEIEQELALYPFLSTESLLRLTQPALTREESVELTLLNKRAKNITLSDDDENNANRLTQKYEEGMLRRAAVLSQLQQRGIDVSKYLVAPA